MKTTKQPQHCAHVAVYYADKCDTMKNGKFMRDLARIPFPLKSNADYTIGGISDAIKWLSIAMKMAKKSAAEWVRAGCAA